MASLQLVQKKFYFFTFIFLSAIFSLFLTIFIRYIQELKPQKKNLSVNENLITVLSQECLIYVGLNKFFRVKALVVFVFIYY